MKYGIVENHQFILIDDDLPRLKNTLPFMPSLNETDIAAYEDSDIEQGYDGVWYEKGYAPQKPLEQARTEKLAMLESAFESAAQTAHCLSSVGFEIDADEIANRDITGLINVLEATGVEQTVFRAYDNSFHEVTLTQLKTMLTEISLNGQYLYQAKWTLEAQIMQAQTEKELEAIGISADAIAALANTLKAQAMEGANGEEGAENAEAS